MLNLRQNNYYEMHCNKGIFVGKVDSIIQIMYEIKLAANRDEEKPRFILYDELGGSYAKLEVKNGFIDLEKIMAKHRDVEAFIHGGTHEGDGGDVEEFRHSNYGTTKVIFSPLQYEGNVRNESDYLSDGLNFAFYHLPSYQIKTVTLMLNSGASLSYSKNNISVQKELEYIKKQEVTMDYLGRLCCPFKAEKKMEAFMKQFEKDVSTISNIKRVIVERETIDHDSYDLERAAHELDDPSIIYMLETHKKTNTKLIIDITNGTARCEEKSTIVYLDVNSCKYVPKELDSKLLYEGEIIRAS